MTEKRPVPLQHFIIYKDKLHMIKDEHNVVYRDVIQKVLKEEEKDRFSKKNEEKKKLAEEADAEPKDIDFKQKAIKAKEQALKKVTVFAIKNQSGGNGPNSQKKAGNYSQFTKTLKGVIANGLLPCVVFCFAKQTTIDVPM
jgi:superfamily II RNA helicase